MFDMVNTNYLPGFALTFPDGFVATHQQFTLTARYDYPIEISGHTITGCSPTQAFGPSLIRGSHSTTISGRVSSGT
jgi:hypothetical protein